MPFKSEAQRRYLFAKEPEVARRWAKHTPKGKKLPERVGKMTAVDEVSALHAMYKDKLPGGKADKRKPRDFDVDQLREGALHEMEHTNDRHLAREIAMDHLTEDKDYYRKLDRMEGKFKDDPHNPADLMSRKHGKKHPNIATRVQPSGHEASMVGMCGIEECSDCGGPMIGKCDCDGGKKKRRLPMIGKADENFDELPQELRALISQLPLEMQATELGGAGQVDPRPSLHAMNYHVPTRYDGSCSTCAHSSRNGAVLDCHAINGDPPVALNGRCDLWTGSAILMRSRALEDGRLLVKADNGATPEKPYGDRQMPDYQFIYHVLPEEDEQERQQDDATRRRHAAHAVEAHGFHGTPPEPTLRGDDVQRVQVPPRRAESMTKPTHMPPLIFKRREEELKENRERLMRKEPEDELYQEAMAAARKWRDEKKGKSKALVNSPPSGL